MAPTRVAVTVNLIDNGFALKGVTNIKIKRFAFYSTV